MLQAQKMPQNSRSQQGEQQNQNPVNHSAMNPRIKPRPTKARESGLFLCVGVCQHHFGPLGPYLRHSEATRKNTTFLRAQKKEPAPIFWREI